MERRSFLRACLAAGGLAFVPKLADRYRWRATSTGIVYCDGIELVVASSGCPDITADGLPVRTRVDPFAPPGHMYVIGNKVGTYRLTATINGGPDLLDSWVGQEYFNPWRNIPRGITVSRV